MKEKSILILTIAFFHLSCYAQSQTKFSAQAVKEDLEYLYKTLEASHYDLYAKTKKETYDTEYKNIRNAGEKGLEDLLIRYSDVSSDKLALLKARVLIDLKKNLFRFSRPDMADCCRLVKRWRKRAFNRYD